MRIGDLAARTGASTRALRYYEEQGLLSADRSPNGQRLYDGTAVDRVALIKRLYAAGLSSTAIRALLPAVQNPGRPEAAHSIELLQAERTRIDDQLAGLMATKDLLEDVIHGANGCLAAKSAAR